MDFRINNNKHDEGDIKCPECYKGFPVRCGCGGLVHSQFVKEEWNDNIITAVKCDKCGDNYYFPKRRKR